MTMDSSCSDVQRTPGFPIQKSADQCSCAAPRGFSQLIASFIGSQCQGIRPAPYMLNLFVSPSRSFISAQAVQIWFLTCTYRRICKACPSCSLVLLAIAFSIYFRVIDSNFFYQRRGLMFDVSDSISRSNLSLIQFSRYEVVCSDKCRPGRSDRFDLAIEWRW